MIVVGRETIGNIFCIIYKDGMLGKAYYWAINRKLGLYVRAESRSILRKHVLEVTNAGKS